jgi:hypothetical protein
MIDLSTKAGVLRFCERQRQEMERCFERRGRFESKTGHAFTGFAFIRNAIEGPWTTGTDGRYSLRRGPELEHIKPAVLKLPARSALPAWMDGSNQTSFFADTIEAFARAGRAIGVLLMSETWLNRSSSEEDFAEKRGREYGWVAKEPERQEGLWMSLEHVMFGRITWLAIITRNPTRLHPWSESPVRKPSDGEGRLANLVEWSS